MFLWAYERSSARYAALRQSLGQPDPFRFRHRGTLRQAVAEVIGSDAGLPVPPRAPSRGRRPSMVEIALTNGRVVKVDECIDPAALALLVAALDGGSR